MIALDPVDLLILGAGLAFALRWPAARNRRAALTLGVLAGAFVFAMVALSDAPAGIVKIAVIWTYVGVVLFAPTLLGMLSASDARTDRALRSIFPPVDHALDAWIVDPGRSSWSRAAEAAEAGLTRLNGLAPVDRRWRATVDLIRRYLTAVRDAANAYDPSTPTQLPPDVTASGFASLVKQIDEAWKAAFRR